MNYLAFDTSGSYLTVLAKGKGEKLVKIEECTHSHSVILMPEIEKCLFEVGLKLEDIDLFACSVGPGSFTGIRIGVATAKAFAYALSKKVLAGGGAAPHKLRARGATQYAEGYVLNHGKKNFRRQGAPEQAKRRRCLPWQTRVSKRNACVCVDFLRQAALEEQRSMRKK